jgi:2-octaprenyl-6-methoxyphenol hydroxylase
MLPADKDHFAVIWTRIHEDADNLLAVNDAEFIRQLQECFGFRLGELTLTAPRRSFPLSLVRAEKMLSGRTVIIGNAVHQLHPVAGQGFNLGLRDVVQLAEMLVRQHREGLDIGDIDLLTSYAKNRQIDHDRVASFTDNLVRIFSNDWLSVALARNAGLVLLDNLPSAKGYLARYAMGLAGRLPRIGSKGYL